MEKGFELMPLVNMGKVSTSTNAQNVLVVSGRVSIVLVVALVAGSKFAQILCANGRIRTLDLKIIGRVVNHCATDCAPVNFIFIHKTGLMCPR